MIPKDRGAPMAPTIRTSVKRTDIQNINHHRMRDEAGQIH